jgi:hypothetical protein
VYDATTQQFGCADDEGAQQVFDGYDNTGGTTLSTTATVLNIDTTRISDDAYTLSADVVTFNEAGTYQIVAHLTVTPTDGNDKNSELIRLIGQNDVGAGFVNVDGATCEDSVRNHLNENGSCTITWIQSYNVGDDIRLQHQISGTGVTGTTVADGSGIIITMLENTGADLAEIYFTEDKMLGQGHIVSVDPSYNKGVLRTVKEYQNDILGVISSHPGIVIGNNTEAEGEKRAALLALVGRVPTKVSIENGSIEAGDPITSSSIEGIGMKAIKPGRVVGIALEGYTEEQAVADAEIGYTRTIEVFIDPAWYSGDPERFAEWFNFEDVLVADGEDGVEITGIRKVIYDILQSFGAVLENGMLAISELFADRIIVKNAEIREAVLQKAAVGDLSIENSLEMVDQRTGKVFCMVLVDAALQPQEGGCDELNVALGSDAPTIEIVGNNPAQISLGATYNDLGVNISDDKDKNLRVTLLLDGSEVSSIALDTASSSEYTITYRVEDTDGNITEVTRLVIVGGGFSGDGVEVAQEETEETVVSIEGDEVVVEDAVAEDMTNTEEQAVSEETNTTIIEVAEEVVVDDTTDEVAIEMSEDIIAVIEEDSSAQEEAVVVEEAVTETVSEEVTEEVAVDEIPIPETLEEEILSQEVPSENVAVEG